MAFLRRIGGKLFTPTSEVHQNHFMTFSECITHFELGKQLHQPHQGLPCQFGHCEDGCLAYRFTSAADKQKHQLIVHSGRKRARTEDHHKGECSQSERKRFRCTFPDCNLEFATHYQLHKHKKQQSHKLSSGRAKKKA